ncbi:MAG TPA: glutathione peroxidase [Steroidobacteraceae bacterium]|nr:glutathione peroxidase [Steroidobacteraceae bacterium]
MSLYDIPVRTLEGKEQTLSAYQDKVLLIVNVASECGYTPQYQGLQALYDRYRGQGLEVLGFPCNQFGQQEPGTAADIRAFCSTNYGVSFPLFEKIEVNGPAAHPLYQYLKHEKPGLLGTEAIKWNFTKFLVDRGGAVVRRYAPGDEPASIDTEVASLLAPGAR